MPLHAAVKALHFINPNAPRNEWAMIGAALHNAYGDAAQEAFTQWSERGDSFKARDAMDTWKSVGKLRGITLGTLLHHAKAAGWRYRAQPMSASERARQSSADTERAARQAQVERDTIAAHARAALRAQQQYLNAQQARPVHPYLLLRHDLFVIVSDLSLWKAGQHHK